MPPAQAGHNSGNAVVKKELESYVKRIEKLIEDRKAVQEDIKEVKAEAKGNGYDMKALNEAIKLRALDSEKRQEQEALRELYLSALGLC